MFNSASLRLGSVTKFLLVFSSAYFGTNEIDASGPDDSMNAAKLESRLRLECVNLFPTGQAIFEFSGVANSEMNLWLSREELDDVHKSIVLDGFRDVSIEYESSPEKNWVSDSLMKKEHATLAEIIQSFRGQEIQIRNDADIKSGRIVCVESIPRVLKQSSIDEEWVSLESEGRICRVLLQPTSVVSWIDSRVEKEFQIATKRQQANYDGREQVTFRVRGDDGQKGRMAVQWTVAPWKASYRISRSLDGYRLTAFSIIDNTTPMDWEDVTLRLIIDQPLGFRSPLSQVLTANRNTVPIPSPFSIAPPMFAGQSQNMQDAVEGFAPMDSDDHGGDSGEAWRKSRGGMGMGGMGMGGMGMGGMGMGGMGMGGYGGFDGYGAEGGYEGGYGGGYGANAGGGYGGSDLGGLAPGKKTSDDRNKFLSQRYGLQSGVASGIRNLIGRRVQLELPNVSIPRAQSKSITLPAIPQRIRELRILAPGTFGNKVLAAFEVQLLDEFQMPSGPGTVWTESGYEGDIMLPRLSSDQSQLISYSVDSLIRLEKKNEQEEMSKYAWNWDSDSKAIEERKTLFRTIQYSIECRDSKSAELLLEHPRTNTNWEPLGAEKNDDAPDVYRYRMELGPKRTTTKDVAEQKLIRTNFHANSDKSQLESLLEHPEFPDELAVKVKRWIEIQSKTSFLSNAIEREDQRIKTYESEQFRIQRLMEVIATGDKLRQRYLDKLANLEDNIERLRSNYDALTQELQALRERSDRN